MKRLLLLLLMTGVLGQARSQFIHKIKADSVLITNDSCTAELNLENSTKTIKGFLYNKGNGRTEFRKAVKLNDSTFVFGDDTLMMRGAGNTFTNGLTNTSGTVKLGGALIENTTITSSSASNNITINGVGGAFNPGDGTFTPFFKVRSTGPNATTFLGVSSGGNGAGVRGVDDSPGGAGIGVGGFSTNSTGVAGAGFVGVNGFSQKNGGFGVMGEVYHGVTPNQEIIPLKAKFSGGNIPGNIVLPAIEIERGASVAVGAGIGTSIRWKFQSYSNSGGSPTGLHNTAEMKVIGTNLFGSHTDYKYEFWALGDSTMHNLLALNGDGNIVFPQYAGSTFTVNDSTTYKPVVMDASGNIRKFDSWAVSGSGGGGGATDGDKGDIIVSNSGANWNLEPYVPKVLASGTVNNAAQMDVLLTSVVLGGTFDRVEIQVELRPSTSGANLQLRFSTDGGSTFNSGASDYEFAANWRTSSGSGNDVGANASAATLVNACGNESSSGAKGTITIHNYFDGTQRTSYQGHLITHSSSSQAIIMSEVGGQRKAAQDTDAVRFFFSTGNITGSYRVIGYRNR